MFIHTYSAKGIRTTNEDNLVTKLNNKNINFTRYDILSIFDGHGGSLVSDILSKSLYKFFENKIPFKCSFNNYITNLYKCFQQKLISKYKFAYNQGSTALICLISNTGSKIYITTINLGDSRAVLSNKYNIAIPLSKDHKPTTYMEYNRIIKAGGIITQEFGDDPRIGNLSVSRSFGDADEKFVSQEPELTNYIINNDNFLILACDGLWDVMTNQEVVDFIQYNYDNCKIKNNYLETKIENNIAYLLSIHAIKKGSTDNVSIIIYFFK